MSALDTIHDNVVLSRANASKLVIKRAIPRVKLDAVLESVRGANKRKGVVLQVFDRNSVASRLHLAAAYANAQLAFKNRTNRSDSMAMEMLLFAAMTDQIGPAIERVGAKEHSELVVFASSKGAFGKVLKELKDVREFNPKADKNRTIRLLERMALSRLRD